MKRPIRRQLEGISLSAVVEASDYSNRSWSISSGTDIHYEIRVLEPILDQNSRLLLSGGPTPGRRFVVCDDGIPSTWRESLKRYFSRQRVDAHILVVQGGEKCKSIETVLKLVRRFEEFELTRRNEPVIIVGG